LQLYHLSPTLKLVAAKKVESALPPLIEINPNAQVEKVVTVNKKDPLLVDLKVTNPIVYIKAWWKKVIANEGVDFRFRIRPLTAIAIAAVVAGTGFGLGRLAIPEPIIKYLPLLAPSPSPNSWRETAFTGILRYSAVSQKYYLDTNSSEAVTLQIPNNVNAAQLIGKRILAVGKQNVQTKVLIVTEASDLEILPTQIIPVPTTLPSPSPITSPSAEPTPIL